MIITPRLTLRPAHTKDIPALVTAMNDWSVAQWLVSPPYPYKTSDGEWFANWSNTPDTRGFSGKFVIADQKSDELLGVVTLVAEGERAELGYWLQSSAQKHGFMLEAVRAAIDSAKQFFPHLTCFATVSSENLSSENCLRAAGFVHKGVTNKKSSRKTESHHTNLFELQW